MISLMVMCVRCGALELLTGMSWSQMDDPKLKPLIEAAESSKREEYGFSPLPTTGDVQIEEAAGRGKGYDLMLHLSRGNVSRTVDFAREPKGYCWIGEQEVHEGPREVDSVDGRYRESISMTFSERARSGTPEGLSILYFGPDTSLVIRTDLTREEMRQLLEAWEAKPYSSEREP